jgi:acyl-CoA:acyl-CoA alkyltransferase
MRYEHVRLEAFGYALPEEITTSEALEEELAPLYERLSLSVGRLELSSGITERRFWPTGTLPSETAARAGEDALQKSGIDRDRLGMLIHASVCRDFLEPATASVVHRRLGLGETCTAFDLSNACLGFVNAMHTVASRIENGEIQAGLVVSGEDGGPLVRQTLQYLRENREAGRTELKLAHASLTIGSGAAALVLCHDSISESDRTLLGGITLADTSHVELCHGGHDSGQEGPLMRTESEALLHAGNALAARTWQKFLNELDWGREDVDRTVTHQVGAAHRRLLLETLQLDPERDFPTVGHLGNIGSVSLPITYALAEEAGFIEPGQRVAMLGIGSGLHCSMLGVRA